MTSRFQHDQEPKRPKELALEVELDEEVRNIIRDKCPTTLLDVTVIEPKGIDDYTRKTQVLKSSQVRELLESVHLDQGTRKELLQRLFGENNNCLGRKQRSCLTRRKQSVMDQGDSIHEGDAAYQPQNTQQIYTTSRRTFADLEKKFECTRNKHRRRNSDKEEDPCPCENCALAGVLADSQKKFLAFEPVRAPKEPKKPLPPDKSVTFKNRQPSTSKRHYQDYYEQREHKECEAMFRALMKRIVDLEKRVEYQEEMAIPRDYFKKVINKVMDNVTQMIQGTSSRKRDPDPPNRSYQVNPVMMEQTFKSKKEYCPSSIPTESIWRWGEDMLNSGKDLKNKVVDVLEEALCSLKKGWHKRRGEADIQAIVDKLSKNLERTLGQEAMKTGRFKEKQPDVCFFPGNKGSRRRKEKALNVAYINPELRMWPEESSVSFKVATSEYGSNMENLSEAKRRQYKREFLKILDKTKTTEKFKLWQSIWNQALENRQTKKDTVTIQIPDPKDMLRQKMIHLEYTIGEMEQLLTDEMK